MSQLICVNCSNYLINGPYQCSCGDRICSDCYNGFISQKKLIITCPKCGEDEVSLNECFKDKAAENELKAATIKCTNKDCPWEGQGRFYKEHIESCKFARVPCPNKVYGCSELLLQSQLLDHMERECKFASVQCPWCSKKVHDKEHHIKHECGHVMVSCPNGCGEKMPKKEVSMHKHTVCTHQMRDCEFKDVGCQFKGNIKELTKHYKEQLVHHNQLVRKSTKELEPSMDLKRTQIDQQMASLKSEVARLQSEVSTKMQPLIDAVLRAETTIQQLQEGFGEMALMVQTLQATSYSGTFIWKIPEVQRRRSEARSGRTVSLYSAPFYTSCHGYKMCLRFYMDGDGSGKDTHLSFFLTLMRGEYDALLPWPFEQTVTLTLLDQDKQKDIFQSFRPDPSSSSFQRPINEMNVASGCPKFAPLSVLRGQYFILLAAGDVECNPGPRQIAGKDILFSVYKSVLECRANWYNLCLALRVPSGDLSAIDQKYRGDAAVCLREGLTIWLQGNHDVDEDDAPTWKMLVDAVADSAGGNNRALALKIAEEHKVIPRCEATPVSPSHPQKADLVKAKNMSSEFNKLYRSVMGLLKMDVAEIKQVLRFSSSPHSLHSRCVPPSVYENATSTKELLDGLYPDYVNPQDVFLLEEIVNSSGSRKCKRLVRIYSDKFF